MTDPSALRKRLLEADAASVRDNDEIDIAGCATIAYSSENPAHPVVHLLDRRSGPGTTRWISARPDTVEHIVVEFDQPQAIGRLVYEVEEAIRERTQEVRVEASEDGGRTYRDGAKWKEPRHADRSRRRRDRLPQRHGLRPPDARRRRSDH